MSQVEPEEHEALTKKSTLPLLLGLFLALAGGAGGFYVTWSGMILTAESGSHDETGSANLSTADVAFIPIDPLVISLRPPAKSDHLLFRAELEVPAKYKTDVEKLMPRVIDVLNSYLRALEMADLQDPAALTRLRAQMLRRVQIVLGQGRVNDLLIMEFVFN